MEDRRFHDRFEKANNRVTQKVRKKIQADIDQRKFEEGKPLCFTLFHTYSILLLPLDRYPDEFKHLYSEAIFDIDMKDDLERAKVINWCRTIRSLYPVKTTADGNCLANAISQAIWGVEDTDAFLRRLLYVTMTTDPKGRFKRRWLNQQRTLTDMAAVGLQLNTDQYNNEWEAVIRATTDIGSEENVGMPYTFLESIHLYIFANIFRRPIILLADNRARNLFGESIQENDIGGIYLPLEWNPEQCEKSPIVLGYNMNHFAPLIGQELVNKDRSNITVKASVCPLVTNELQSLKLHFLLPNEESKVGQLLTRYMQIEEVIFSIPDGFMNVPCARLMYNTLPDELNITQEHRKDCEKKFRYQVDEEVGLRPRPNEIPSPFHFQVMNQNDENMAAKGTRKPAKVKVVQPMQIATGASGRKQHCTVIGCKMYGSPEFNGLCSKCFGDFTKQYAQDEDASRRRRTERSNIAPPMANPAPGYNDLSIMGENCQTGCGFRCSTETYPYCHECYPKYANQARAEARPTVETVEMSLMSEKCGDPTCTYRASKLTFPYCHQCYDKLVPKAQPTAPPVSVREEHMEVTSQPNDTVSEPNLQLRIEEEPETNLIEIRQPHGPGSYPVFAPTASGVIHPPMDLSTAGGSGVLNKLCKTGGCLNNAIRGNDGFCDKCYDHSLFGEGDIEALDKAGTTGWSVTCKTADCKDRPANGCDLCLQCFLREGTLPSTCDLTQKQLGQQLTTGEKLKAPHAINLPLSPAYTKYGQVEHFVAAEKERSSPLPRESIAVEEVGNCLPVANAVTSPRAECQIAYIGESNETHRKYICAKAGCEGIRIDDSNGLCYECSKVGHRKTENRCSELIDPRGSSKSSNLDESAPFISDTPIELSEEQMKQLYPIVVSSKQKVKCAAPSCENMIYPPSKLCEVCTADIQRSQAERMKSGELRLTAPISTARRKEFVEPQRHTIPIARAGSKEANDHQRHTVPIAKARAKLCIEKDCERFGDPAQKDRCSRHYNLAMQRFRQPSPPGNEPMARQLLNGEVPANNYNVASQRNRDTVLRMNVPPTPVENGDKLTAAMYKIENTRKSKNKCKNFSRTGCGNYANPAKQGFCNHCYDAFSVQALLGHPRLPGLNQFD